MKNVLFIGPYRQFDGWGIASRGYLNSLALTGHNIYSRPVYLSNNIQSSYNDSLSSRFEIPCNQPIDTIIQHSLPFNFVKYGNVKNIGLCFFESHNLFYSSWIDNINLLDELWVCSNHEKKYLLKSGVTIPIKTVPIPQNIKVYGQHYGRLLPLEPHSHEFKFYFIGENTKRKNTQDIVTAFHSEFVFNEDVRLVLKINDANKTNLDGQIHKNKVSMGIYKRESDYRREVIISGRLKDVEMHALHQSCDCFINAAYGEACSLPAFDALGFGRTPIVNKNTGMSQFVTDNNGFLVNSFEIPAIDEKRPTGDLYKTTDSWFQIDIIDLRAKMRQVFEMPLIERTNKQSCGISDIKKYSHENIAKLMVDYL